MFNDVFINILKSPIYWFIILLVIVLYFFTNKIIGWFGEFWVKQELRKLSKDYLILNDVMVKTSKGTSQIDHLVFSKYGIFVIETKQYNGVIIGNDYDKNWKIKLRTKSFYVNNPVHQNYGHVQSIKEITSLTDDKLFSIVCISSRARIKVKSDIVISIIKLVSYIESKTNEILPNYTEYYDFIKNLNIVDKKERKNHILNAKQVKKEKEEYYLSRCPKCGGELIKRNGQYGEFYGCSNYPKCKYIKK